MRPIEFTLWAISVIVVACISWALILGVYECIPEQVKYKARMCWDVTLVILIVVFILTGLGWFGFNLIKYIFHS